MRHNQIAQGLIGDIVEPVNMQNVNGKMVARTRVGFVEERTSNGQKQFHRASFQAEAWGELAKVLATVPVGHTIMFAGKYQNQKYQDQAGQTKWYVKITMLSLAVAGPSQYPAQNSGQQQTQAPNYGQQTQPGYGQAPQQQYGVQNQPAQQPMNGGGARPPQGYPQAQPAPAQQQPQMMQQPMFTEEDIPF